jgi:hypothetical protein
VPQVRVLPIKRLETRARRLSIAGADVRGDCCLCSYAYYQRQRGHWSWQTEMVKRERAVELAGHFLRNLQNGQQEWPLSHIWFPEGS